MTDQETVRCLTTGDQRVIKDFFFVRCKPMLMYIGRYFCQDKSAPEELIGEFYEFLSADDWHKLKIFKFSCSLNSYVTVIASRYFQRKRDKEMMSLDENIALAGNLQAERNDDAFFMEDFNRMIGNLQPFDRFLVRRILIDGEKPGDILAEAEEFMRDDGTISTGAQDKKQFAGYIYTRYNRVRKSLQKNMRAIGY